MTQGLEEDKLDNVKEGSSMTQGLLTTSEVALLTGVHRDTVVKWVLEGRLPYVEVSRHYRFLPGDVSSFILEHRTRKPVVAAVVPAPEAV